MKRSIICMILVVILLLILPGCSMQSTDTSKNSGANLNQNSTLDTGKNNSNSSGTADNSVIPDNVKTDTGRYVGQIDSNSIEIKISGVPDEIAAKAFRFTEDIAADFENLKLQKDEQLIIEYYVNDYDQNILVKIKRL